MGVPANISANPSPSPSPSTNTFSTTTQVTPPVQPLLRFTLKSAWAGTPHIAGTIGLMAAIKYLQSVGIEKIHDYEMELADMCISALKEAFGEKIHIVNAGMENRSSGIVTFNLEGVHTHDVAQILNTYNVAVRAGHHCAMPLHTHFGLSGSARASFYMYNTEDDVYKLVHALKEAQKLLS
jgi:cysteine desulfurase/selenocysteine lyase